MPVLKQSSAQGAMRIWALSLQEPILLLSISMMHLRSQGLYCLCTHLSCAASHRHKPLARYRPIGTGARQAPMNQELLPDMQPPPHLQMLRLRSSGTTGPRASSPQARQACWRGAASIRW